MAGPNHKYIEITDTVLQVRWVDYSVDGAPRYQWFLRNAENIVVDGGMDLRLDPGDKPNASKALIELMRGLREAADFGDGSVAASWAADHPAEVDHAIGQLAADLGLQQ